MTKAFPSCWENILSSLPDIETPYLLFDLNKAKERYFRFRQAFPEAKIFYPVKANPAVEVLSLLNDLGSHFDISSVYELEKLLAIGVSPQKISYGNTIKKEKDIEYAYKHGVHLFACDSESELIKQSQAAPASKAFFRISADGSGSDWPLSKKFGCHPEMILAMIKKAKEWGIVPYGVSFHVGSQQRDIGQWDKSIAHCKWIFDAAKKEGIELSMLNLGGGFPSEYLDMTHPIETYVSEIKGYLKNDFGHHLPEIFVEPGRVLVGGAGVVVSEIILISKKSKSDLYKWIYLDVGLFGGLIETLGEAIKYPIMSNKSGRQEKVILAGPTCDSMDILYQNHKYSLPADIEIGDKVFIFSTGAYTTSYSSIEFNGFPPLKSHYLPVSS